MKTIEKYYKEVRYLETLGNISGYLDYQKTQQNPQIYTRRLKYFLKLLGNPQKKIKNYIHIGGTSGKGSTCNFLHNILVSSGKNVGLFTSPFVTETIEKYKVNDKFISPVDFVKIVDKLKPAINTCAEKSPYGIPSYFEVCFVIAVIYFTEKNCDYFISEVGLGGEFDATNIVSKKKITCITHVDYDHMDLLGNTLEKIATTKSKIITKESNFFTNDKRSKLRNIFKKECENVGAVYNYVNKKPEDLKYLKNKFSFAYMDQKYKMNLFGQHQASNAILAIEMAKFLNIDDKFIKKGIEKTKIPGRFEIINKRPLVVLDVAHNPDKFKTTLDNIGLMKFKKLHLIYATAANKDNKMIAKLSASFFNTMTITKFFNPYRKCENPKLLKKYWSKENKKLKIKIELDPWIALEKVLKKAKPTDAILIAGSFFLVGELRKKWWNNEKILRTRKII